jgi:hypothetical protein
MLAGEKIAYHAEDEASATESEPVTTVWQSDPAGFRIVRCFNRQNDSYDYVIQAADGAGPADKVCWRVLSVYAATNLDRAGWDLDWGPLLSALATAVLRRVDPEHMHYSMQLW